MLVRVLFPALFAMVAAAPAAHVDVQVERPAPGEPGKTRHETISMRFRAVDYRPAWHAELRLEIRDEQVERDDDGDGPTAEPVADDTPRAWSPTPLPAAPVDAPARTARPRRADLRAGRVALPPPAARA